MSEEIDNAEVDVNKKRPTFLKVLCILTFIWTGIKLFSGIINLVNGKLNEEQLTEAKVQMTEVMNMFGGENIEGFDESLQIALARLEDANDNFYLSAFLVLLTAGTGLFGAIKMWKGFKIGFHLYIVYCLLEVGSIYMYTSAELISTMEVIFSIVLSGLFIFMYSRNLKWMR